VLWQTAGRIGAHRLQPFVPELLDRLALFGELTLAPAVDKQLRRASAATLGRLLAPARARYPARGPVQSWTELVTLQVLPGAQRTMRVDGGMERARQATTGNCPTGRWTVLRRGPDEILFEWETRGCPRVEDRPSA
jgi:hypothetical protein